VSSAHGVFHILLTDLLQSTGSFSFYAGTGDQQAVEVVRLMREEMEEVLKNGITEKEFQRCKDQLKGSYLLAQAGTSSRMNALGKTALLLDKLYSEEDTLRRIEGVTLEDIRRILPKVLDVQNMSIVCVGRVHKREKEGPTF
jgi:predicted Zn-dependent peptidase